MTDRPAPDWLRELPDRVATHTPDYYLHFAPPERPRRRSAVLMLFGPATDGGEDVLLTERAHDLRSHAGQVSFPGGRIDPDDDGPVAAALRETEEEVGVDPATVDVLGVLPELYLSPSGNAVTPVLGWWLHPQPPRITSHVEVAHVVRAPVSELLDPANRFTVTGFGAYRGPGFAVAGLYIWGFTAKLLESLFEIGEVTVPWDERAERPLPDYMIAAMMREHARGDRR